MISDKTTLKELIDIDIKNVVENLLKPNKDRINYDEESCAWFIFITSSIYSSIYPIISFGCNIV